jgi:hypothetical protein
MSAPPPPTTPMPAYENDVYTAREIVHHKWTSSGITYLVYWGSERYGEEAWTWEPEEHILDCWLISQYNDTTERNKESEESLNPRYAKERGLCNYMLCDALRKSPYHSRGTILVLEGRSIGTSRMLAEWGVDLNRVIIPNPNHFDSIKSTLRSFVQTEAWYHGGMPSVKHMYMHEALRFVRDRSLAMLYLDYCTSLRGNKVCSPIKDLKLAFKKLACNGSILGVKVSHRAKSGSSGLTELVGTVVMEASSCERIAILKNVKRYGQLVFAMFVIQ